MSSTMRTAFIIQMHKYPEQVNKFIYQLISEAQADVFIHIDKKNYRKLAGKIINSPNVKVLQQCINCEWGDISQVDATILLLREVLASNHQYDFVCLRSGQDLLVKGGFKEFLANHKDTIFMNYRYLSEKNSAQLRIRWPKIMRRRYTTAHPIRIFRKLLLNLYSRGINIFPNKNKWPKDYRLYKGSQWFTIPYNVAQYIIVFLDQNEWFYKFFKNTLVPDESFFQTLILNSPYKSKVVNNNLLFLKWGETLGERNSPKDLKMDDVKLIKESQKFFARKFDESVDPIVIEYFTNRVMFGARLEKEISFH